MSLFQERLLKAIQESGLSYGELSKMTGIAKSTLQRYATGYSKKIPIDSVPILEKALNLPLGHLIGWGEYPSVDNMEKRSKTEAVKVPVLGRVAAGIPLEAIEDVLDYEEITPEMAKTGEFFGLKINGDSMEPRMSDGDVVIVRRQEEVENGEIAIVLVNGNDATCKKFLKHANGVSLVSFNPAFSPQFYTKEECASLPLRIIGKVVELRAKF